MEGDRRSQSDSCRPMVQTQIQSLSGVLVPSEDIVFSLRLGVRNNQNPRPVKVILASPSVAEGVLQAVRRRQVPGTRPRIVTDRTPLQRENDRAAARARYTNRQNNRHVPPDDITQGAPSASQRE